MVHKVTTRKSLTDTSIDNLLSTYAQIVATYGSPNVQIVRFVKNGDSATMTYDLTILI